MIWVEFMLGNLRHFVGNVLGARWGGGGGAGGGRGVHYIKKKNRKIKQIDCIVPEALDLAYQFISETLLARCFQDTGYLGSN